MQAPAKNRGRRDGWGSGVQAGGVLIAFAAPLLHKLLDRIDAGLAYGAIELTLPGGKGRRLGGRAPGPEALVDIRNWRALWRLATGGSIGWYEAWQAREWTSPDPVPLFDLFMRNRATLGDAGRAQGLSRLAKRAWHWMRRNDRDGSRRNIAYHYDLGNDFYAPWLDAGMTYSSALFAEPGMALEDAQAAKLAAILERTATKPGDAILEIGCGWGSFAEAAARDGRRVHGLTLSTEQKAYVEARMDAAGLAGVEVSLTDYRDVSGQYEAIASIEMVEAVGEAYWPAYLAAIAQALKPGGRAAIQYIAIDDAIFDAYARNVDFIQTYVFPGGLLLSEGRFRAIAAEQGLSWHDCREFGQDYAETLKVWRERFDVAVASGRIPAEFDPHFIDLWRYYLMYCEGGFRGGGIWVAQVTLIKN
jgi:cyclopropane-fatty-acyl-phospholipid synthase